MKLYFHKMHSLGNDFMVIDGVRQNFQPNFNLIKQWSNRKTGIGFDQLLIVEARKNKAADYFYRIFNADGNEVAQCGNGARCLAKFIRDERLIDRNEMTVETIAGLLKLKIEGNDRVTVTLGKPIIKNIENNKIILSIGNPHCVFLVDNIDSIPIQETGTAFNKQHPDFPEGVNVGFMQVVDKQHIKLRVYERGVGETLACGSGASAAVVAGRVWELLNERVTVSQPGGEAIVTWPDAKETVSLTGPAVNVFNGTIEI
jgi:diaminopimelate epimerase